MTLAHGARGAAPLIAVTLLGFLFRAAPVAVHDWPLRDGGLFWQMTDDLLAGSLVPPLMTSYNGGIIPFAYPPLSFYVVAIVEAVTPLDRALLFRALPVLFSTAAIPAVAALASTILPTRRHAIVAAAAYAVIPAAFEIHVTGGGLPRSLGFLLALGALSAGFMVLRGVNGRLVAGCGVLGGLALTAHPQSAVLVVVGLAAGWLATASRRGLIRLVTAAAVAALVSAPWWLSTLLRHGPEPLLAALSVTQRDLAASAIAYLFIPLVTAPAIAVLDAIGQARVLVRRQLTLPLWRLGSFLLDLRYSPVSSSIPVALLASVGLVDGGAALAESLRRRASPAAVRLLEGAAALGLAGVAIVPPAALSISLMGPAGALSRADRDAMIATSALSPSDASFVVLTGSRWGSDDVAEWFPALSGRVSIVTGQGLEWTNRREAQSAAEQELRRCRHADLACVDRWIDAHSPSGLVGVYVTGPASSSGECCPQIAEAVRSSGRYRVLADGTGALIAVPREAISP